MLRALTTALNEGQSSSPAKVLIVAHGRVVREGNKVVATELMMPSDVLGKRWVDAEDLQKLANELRFKRLDTETVKDAQEALTKAKAVVDLIACNINKQEAFSEAFANLLGGPAITIRGPKARATLWVSASGEGSITLNTPPKGRATYGTPKGEKALYPVKGREAIAPQLPVPPDVTLRPKKEVVIP
jgi:hypothetical protein